MVPTAHLIDDDVPGFAGEAKKYRLSEPIRHVEGGREQAEHEVIVFISTKFNNPETVVTTARRGASIRRLPGSIQGFTNHEYSLFVAGYALGAPDLAAPAEAGGAPGTADGEAG